MFKLYNTLTRKKEVFKPIKRKKVGVYSCGPTVYGNQHIGNMYAYIQWDSMIRFFKFIGYKTKWVMNITDVGHLTSDEDEGEDKMEKGAKREGLTVWEVANKYIKQFTKSMELLNIQTPDVLCRATDHIEEQIDLIRKIEKNGFAYKTQTGLVFDTSKFPDYSKFAKLNLEKQFAGKRVKVDPEKKKPWDFLLWITNKPKQIMQWDSPWGRGFPGWHIECTAMSVKYLGKNFDIHTGGKEHIPVHHTNEIAQSFGAFKKQVANYWLHNDWLFMKGEKISKSIGNVVLVSDLIEKNFNPLAFRYLALTSHYRQGLDFSWDSLSSAQNALNSLYEKMMYFKNSKEKERKSKTLKFKNELIEIIEDDLNFPKAIAFLWKIIREKDLNSREKEILLLEIDKILGLGLDKIKKFSIPKEIEKLALKREEYRKNKEWEKADEIRKEIERKGYKLEDTSEGYYLSPILN